MQTAIESVTDEELIQRASKGDRQAFGLLYEKYLEAIYQYMFYRVGSEQEAEDLTEKVFLKIWERIPRLSREAPVRNFRAWLYRISHNLVVDYYRTRKETAPLSSYESQIPADRGIEDNVDNQHEREMLVKAITQLEPQYQEIIVARFINQLSHAETAEIVRKSEGHVRVLQYRALKKLRSIMADQSNG